MREIGLEELKAIQLDILVKVRDFCAAGNLRYFLAGGTLLGAVRHKGYIPWDDDIDIVMPRPDYDRFVMTFNGSDENLEVLAPEHDGNFYAPYANVCDRRTLLIEEGNGHNGKQMGVKIDVFPLDGVPQDFEKYRALQKRINVLNKRMWYKRVPLSEAYASGGWKEAFIYWEHKARYIFRSYASLQAEVGKLARSVPYEGAEYVDDIVYNPYPLARVQATVFSSFIEVPFEDRIFRIPSGYDAYLRALYDDYMQLPPEEKRVAHHGFSAYWK